MADQRPVLSLVLPIFNEEANIPTLYSRLVELIEGLRIEAEVIFVDDGSRDSSLSLLRSIANKDSRCKILSFSRNFGHQTAVSAGMFYSSGQSVAILDADLQDPPALVGEMIKLWRAGNQVIYAVRKKRKEGPLKRLAYFAFYRLQRKISEIDMPLDSGDFCLMDRVVVDVINALPEKRRFVRGLRAWSGFKQVPLVYERSERMAGDSKYSLSKLLRLAFDGLVSFSSAPLRLALVSGLIFCLMACLTIVALVVWKISGITLFGVSPGQAAGWTSLASLILLVSGVQLILLGVIGEYLGRLFDETKNRDPWIIAEATGFKKISYRGARGWYVSEERSF